MHCSLIFLPTPYCLCQEKMAWLLCAILQLRKSDHKLAHLSELLLLFLLNNLARGFLLLSTGWGTFIHGFLASPGRVVKGLLAGAGRVLNCPYLLHSSMAWYWASL